MVGKKYIQNGSDDPFIVGPTVILLIQRGMNLNHEWSVKDS